MTKREDRTALRRLLRRLDGERQRDLYRILRNQFDLGLMRDEAGVAAWLLGRGDWQRARQTVEAWLGDCAVVCHHDGLSEDEQRALTPALTCMQKFARPLARVAVRFTTEPLPKHPPQGEIHVPAPWAAGQGRADERGVRRSKR